MSAKCWIFTVNNYDEKDTETLKDIMLGNQKHVVRYCIAGKEVGEKCGTPHYQGYVQFHERKARKEVCYILGGRASVRIAKGSYDANYAYCSKQGEWFEWGDPITMGDRTDLAEIRDMVKAGKSLGQIMDVTTSGQAIMVAEKYMKYFAPLRTWKTWTCWIWGPPGAGKTYKAKQMWQNIKAKRPEYRLYVKKSRDGKWWEGYDGQEVVVMDDVRKSWNGYSFLDMIGLSGDDELRVEIKGSSVPFVAKYLFITSVKHPAEEMRTEGEPMEQLKRRIDRLIKIEPELREPYKPVYGDDLDPEES